MVAAGLQGRRHQAATSSTTPRSNGSLTRRPRHAATSSRTRSRRRGLDASTWSTPGCDDEHGRPAAAARAWLAGRARSWLTYGDGVCDVDLGALLAFHRAPRPARDRDGGPAAGALRRPRVRRRPGRPSSPRSRRSARAGSTAASSSSSRRVFDYLDGDDDEPGSRRARAAGARTASWWRTATTASGSAWTRSATSGCSTRSGTTGDAPWKVWPHDARRSGRDRADARDRRHRPRRRLARSGACSSAGPTSSAWCATGSRESELVRSGLLDRVDGRARATSGTRRCSSGPSASTRSTRSSTSPPRPSSASPTGTRSRRSRRTSRGTWTRARSVPPQPGSSSRSCSPRPTRRTASSDALPYAEDTPLEGRHPYDVSKSCADLIAQSVRRHLRAAGRHHPLRQLLRRRRPELEPHRPGHDPLGPPRRAPGDPLRRQLVRDYFYVEDGAAAYLLLAERLAASRTGGGEAFNFSNETPAHGPRARRAHPRG